MTLHHWGQKSPAEIGVKRVSIYRHALFRTQQLGILFHTPPAHLFNPIKVLWLMIAMGSSLDVVRVVFRHIWHDCNDVVSPGGFATLCETVGSAEGATAVEQPTVKNTLRTHTDAAIVLGVFGVFTLIHKDELFRGENATVVFLQSLCAGWLSTPEVQHASTLSVGIWRG